MFNFGQSANLSQVCVSEQLIGQTYQVCRAGSASNFRLEFQTNGRLVVKMDMQDIQEIWQPSPSNSNSVILGGRTMPPAEVVIGSRDLGNCTIELWEPSPPMGAPALIGKNITATDVAVATRLELIVDRSGSMGSLHAATVEGLNRFLMEQRTLPHAASMTARLVTFDDRIEVPWAEGTPLGQLAVTPAMVLPRGMTALLDAIGTALSGTPLQPPRVVCIVTDGMENSSRQFTRPKVNELIATRRDSGWTFIFLAANQDAIGAGAALGIGAGTCATFSATLDGISGGFGSASAASCRGAAFGSAAATFSSLERSACGVGGRR